MDPISCSSWLQILSLLLLWIPFLLLCVYFDAFLFWTNTVKFALITLVMGRQTVAFRADMSNLCTQWHVPDTRLSKLFSRVNEKNEIHKTFRIILTFVRFCASMLKNNLRPLVNVKNDLLHVVVNFKNVDLIVLIGLDSSHPEDNHLILKILKK